MGCAPDKTRRLLCGSVVVVVVVEQVHALAVVAVPQPRAVLSCPPRACLESGGGGGGRSARNKKKAPLSLKRKERGARAPRARAQTRQGARMAGNNDIR